MTEQLRWWSSGGGGGRGGERGRGADVTEVGRGCGGRVEVGWGLGLGPRSGLGRRILWQAVGGVYEGLRLRGADSRSGAGMAGKRGRGNDGEGWRA